MSAVDLFWIPLGAGARFVHMNGIIYEALTAMVQRRARYDLYHSALEITVDEARFLVEMTPVPDAAGHRRGVVAEGPVGLRPAARLRVFRYEVRRWRDGIIPDLDFAIDSPVPVTRDDDLAQRVFDLVPHVPTATWGRDELGAGEMWSCNSLTSWVLARAGADVAGLRRPPRARAPGWDAGVVVAGRRQPPAMAPTTTKAS